jgi:serine/threonine protein kinase
MAFIEKLRSKFLDVTRIASTNSSTNGHHLNSRKSSKKHLNLIFDRDPNATWEILGEIGDGAFGKVYKTRHRQTGVLAAAKIVEKCTEDELDDYMIEIDILSECNHKNIVKIYESYFYDQKLWMLIEFCSHGAVDTLMFDLDKSLNEQQIQYIIRETLEALSYLHENMYVIHRDMKAGNILLTEQGHVKLADFGVSAKNMSPAQKRCSFIGTPYWMSPEIIACETDKESSYDTKTDIWSLGITCIELAEKEPPHNELNPNRVMMKIRKSDPPKLKDQHKWSKTFQDFLSVCLDRNPESRYTARDLLRHPFILNFKGDEKVISMLLSEKNATINITEEMDNDDTSQNQTNTNEVNKNLILLFSLLSRRIFYNLKYYKLNPNIKELMIFKEDLLII